MDASKPPPFAVAPLTGQRGRPTSAGGPKVQLSLRLPANWIYLLRKLAIEASDREDRMITPQEIVRRLVELSLDSDAARDQRLGATGEA